MRRGNGLPVVVFVAVAVAIATATPTAFGFVGFAGAAGATPAWRVVPSANPPGPAIGQFSAVACASASDCFAVGHAASGPGSSSLIELWNGSGWSIVASPNVAGATQTNLAAVT